MGGLCSSAERELGKETDISTLLQNPGAVPALCSALPPEDSDSGEELPGLPAAVYPEEPEDLWTPHCPAQTVVGSSLGKPDCSPVLLPEHRSACFGWTLPEP